MVICVLLSIASSFGSIQGRGEAVGGRVVHRGSRDVHIVYM